MTGHAIDAYVEQWRCKNCPDGSFSVHLLDVEEECPNTGAPDYDAEDALRRRQYLKDILEKRKMPPSL
jgi:hypothetical protein